MKYVIGILAIFFAGLFAFTLYKGHIKNSQTEASSLNLQQKTTTPTPPDPEDPENIFEERQITEVPTSPPPRQREKSKTRNQRLRQQPYADETVKRQAETYKPDPKVAPITYNKKSAVKKQTTGLKPIVRSERVLGVQINDQLITNSDFIAAVEKYKGKTVDYGKRESILMGMCDFSGINYFCLKELFITEKGRGFVLKQPQIMYNQNGQKILLYAVSNPAQTMFSKRNQ